MYRKSFNDCSPNETNDDFNQQNGHYSRTSCTDGEVTPYVTPPAPLTSHVSEITRFVSPAPRSIIRCNVCATTITSRSHDDVAMETDNQTRRAISRSPEDDDVNAPV